MELEPQVIDETRRTIFDVQRLLSAVFLRSEFTRDARAHPLTVVRQELFARLGLVFNPVIGVGIFGTQEPSEVHLFVAFYVPIDLEVLDARFGAPGVTIRSIVTGRLLPATRPAAGGDSLGDRRGATGTFGCIVLNAAGDELILSCNHVIASVNAASLGDDVWQPGALDGGTLRDAIGVLHDSNDIDFVAPNTMDAALAKPLVSSDVSARLRMLGPVRGYDPAPRHGTSVEKMGWKTGRTAGTLHYKNLSMVLPFGTKGTALFDGQYGIVGTLRSKDFSEDGDSGALVVNGSAEAVGLLIGNASGIDLTFASPIEPILNHFSVTLV